MALQKQILRVPLGKMDTNVENATAEPGVMSQYVNMYRTRLKRMVKRAGHTSLTASTSSGTAMSSAKKLATRGTELVALANNRLWSYSPGDALWYDQSKRNGKSSSNADFGLLSAAQVTHSLMGVDQRNDYNLTVPDVAYGGGYYCYTWESTNVAGAFQGAFFAVVDALSGVVLYRSLISATGTRPKVVATTAHFHVFFVETGTNLVRTIRVAFATPTSPDAVTSVNANTTNGIYDIQVRGNDATRILVAYSRSASNGRIVEWNGTTNASAVDSGDVAFESDRAIGWLHHDYSTGNVFAAVADGSNGVNCIVINGTTLVPSAINTIDAAATTARNVTGFVATNSDKTVFWDVPGAAAYQTTIQRGFFSGAGPTSNGTFATSVGLASRAFAVGSTYYLMGTYESPLQNAYYLFDATRGTNNGVNDHHTHRGILSRILYGLGGGLTAKQSSLTSVVSPSADKYTAAIQEQTAIIAKAGTTGDPSTFYTSKGITSCTFDAADARLGRPVDANGELLIPGGCPKTYNGATMYEAGFNHHPEQPTLAQTNTGSLTLLATYQFAYTYRWVDPITGRLYRSAVSAPASITLTGGNNRVTFTTTPPAYLLTQREIAWGAAQTETTLETWRTKGNDPIFRLIPAGTDAGAVADSTLDSYEQLYITGNPAPLENFPPPPTRCFWLCQNRVWAIDSEDPYRVWFTKEIKDGEGLYWHPDLSIRADEPLTAGADMEGLPVLFSENSVYVVSGDGPADTGVPNYPLPNKISVVAGCTIPDSIALCPAGLVYRGPKGFYMLTRGRQVQWIGAPVQAYNSLTVSGVVVMDDLNQVRWTTSNGTFPDVFIYDWVYDEWFTFDAGTAVSAVFWNSNYCHMTSGGTVKQETPGTFNDDGAAITSYAYTHWWSLAGLFSDARLWNLRQSITPKGTTAYELWTQYDFNTTFFFVDLPVTTAGPFDVETKLARQTFEAIKFVFQESSTTEGVWLSDVVFEVGTSGILKPLASTQRVA